MNSTFYWELYLVKRKLEGFICDLWQAFKVKKKNFTLEQATKAERGRRYIAILFFQTRR